MYLQCFFEPLKKVQVEGFLMYVEPQEIFCNLDELCYVSNTFPSMVDVHSALIDFLQELNNLQYTSIRPGMLSDILNLGGDFRLSGAPNMQV